MHKIFRIFLGNPPNESFNELKELNKVKFQNLKNNKLYLINFFETI